MEEQFSVLLTCFSTERAQPVCFSVHTSIRLGGGTSKHFTPTSCSSYPIFICSFTPRFSSYSKVLLEDWYMVRQKVGGQCSCFPHCCRAFRGEQTPLQNISEWEAPARGSGSTGGRWKSLRWCDRTMFLCVLRLHLFHLLWTCWEVFSVAALWESSHYSFQLTVTCFSQLQFREGKLEMTLSIKDPQEWKCNYKWIDFPIYSQGSTCI